jgi:hypothetical protein
LISNIFLLVLSVHGKITGNEQAFDADQPINWDDIAKTKKKLAAMRFKRETENEITRLDLEALRARVTTDKPKRDGRSLRDRHRSAMNHWFKSDGTGEEEVIAQRLSAPPASRLPAIEPLPSSEDSYLAFTCDDAVFFDDPVQERWKDFADERTAVVRVRRSDEQSYSFAGEALFDEDAA